ncbi:hypothetical protein V5799_025451, partial [Amblyomma americanum]
MAEPLTIETSAGVGPAAWHQQWFVCCKEATLIFRIQCVASAIRESCCPTVDENSLKIPVGELLHYESSWYWRALAHRINCCSLV